MKTLEMTTNEKLVFDARKAADLVSKLSRDISTVHIVLGNKRVNAKSILGVVSLVLKPKCDIRIEAEGMDAEKSINSIKEILG